MDISQFNKKISKISLIADNLSSEGQFSILERDLLLSYIRDLYELVLDGQNVKPTTIAPKVTASPVEPEAPKVVAPEPAKVVAPPPAAIIAEPIVAEPIVEAPKPQSVVITEEPKPAPVVAAEPIQVAPVYTPAPAPQVVVTPSMPVNNADLAELFAEDKITDLSDKLALTPIKDLTKSMGINERIFTQQELFRNNQALFNATLEGLNKCQNFDEAKQYLLDNVIYTFDWTNENKIKKANTFIKLIKRRFV